MQIFLETTQPLTQHSRLPNIKSLQMARARKHLEAFDVWSMHPEAINELCEAVCATADTTLSAWCTAKQFQHSTVRAWIKQDERCSALFELAERQRAHLIADRIGALAREPLPMRHGRPDPLAIEYRKLQIGTLRWICAQLNPQYRA